MKKISIVLTGCLAVLAFVLPIQAATIWMLTESGEIDVNFLTDAPFTFAIFDEGDFLNNDFNDRLELANPGDTVSFEQLNGD